MKKIKMVFAALSVIFILLSSTIFLTEKYSIYSFLANKVNGKTLSVFFAVCASICLLISAIAAIISKGEKRIVLNSVIKFVCICVISFFTAIPVLNNREYKYYEFNSPDGEYTVVAQEWSFLLGGGVDFYERINPLIITHKNSFSTDDGYLAISSGDYSVEWEENIAIFTVQNGNRIYKTIRIVL